VFDKDAVYAIHQLMRALTPVEIQRLHSTVRASSYCLGRQQYDWLTLTPQEVELLSGFGAASVSALGLASFHHNGYVREAAIKKLSQITTGAELPFLIIRLNDWVSNVRTAAYEAIRPRLVPQYCQAIIDNLQLFNSLEHAQRVDHKQIIDTINNVMQSDECRPLLLETLNTDDRFLRRAGFRLGLDPAKPDFESLAKRGLRDHDIVIRSLAAKRISDACDGPACLSFIESMKRDRHMPVRREALRMAVKLGPPGDLEELRKALLDTHASMREEARYHLRKMAAFDVAAFYRQQLPTAERHTLYAVVSGLGEFGNAVDDALIVPYTSHPTPKMRRAALKALASLRPDPHMEVFMKALSDEAPRVSSLAVKALRRKPSSLSAARLWEILKSTPHFHVKRHAFHLIERCAKWDSIPYLLSALCETNETLVEMGQSAVSDWVGSFNRSFASPTPSQIAATRTALNTCGHLLDETTLERLQFSLKGF